MGVMLFDLVDDTYHFSVNFWHYRAIVEAIRRLETLPNDRAADLHDVYVCEMSREEAHTIAKALNDKLIPTLEADDSLLWGGEITKEPDDGVFHRDPADQHKNYRTTADVLQNFADFCAKSHGFRVT